MLNGRPLDPVRASFYLVGGVITVYGIVVLANVVACLLYAPEILSGKYSCDKEGRLTDLLSQALSAALAFAGGLMRNSPAQPPPHPPSDAPPGPPRA